MKRFIALLVTCALTLSAQQVSTSTPESKTEQAEIEAKLISQTKAGSIQAAYSLGLLYQYSSIPPRYKEAYDSYSKSVDLAAKARKPNIPDALFNMGYLRMNGLGVSADYQWGMSMFHDAAAQGDTVSMLKVAQILASRGGEDATFARSWVERAAKLGDPNAKRILNSSNPLAYTAVDQLQVEREREVRAWMGILVVLGGLILINQNGQTNNDPGATGMSSTRCKNDSMRALMGSDSVQRDGVGKPQSCNN